MTSSRLLPLDYNVSTFGNGSRNYQAINDWLDATDNDLVTAKKGEVLLCYADAASYAQSLNPSGATTDSDYFRVVMAAPGQGHKGIPNTGFRLEAAVTNLVDIDEDNFGLYNIDLFNDGNSATNVRGVKIVFDNFKIVGCLIKASNAGAGGGFSTTCQVVKTFYSINNLLYGSKTDGLLVDAGTGYIYNDTIVGNGQHGINRNGGNVHAINNVIQGNVTGQVNGVLATNTTNVTSGVVFRNSGNDNYLLSSLDVAAQGQGTDLSSDANFPFNDDVLRNTRIVPWTVGFHDLAADNQINPVKLKAVELKAIELAPVELVPVLSF